ncbi:C2 domain-containing protein [Aquimarina sp. M1]
MKNIIYVIFIILLLSTIISCEKEVIEDTDLTSIEQDEDIKDEGVGQKVLIVGGEPVWAGGGYSPAQDRSFRPALEQSSFQIASTSNIPDAVEYSIDVIENNEDLYDFVKKSSSSNINFGFGIFGFGRKSQKTIEEEINISNNTITVVARVALKKIKYFAPEGFPMLSFRAQRLLNEGKFNIFLKKFGPMYVQEHTLGGEVFYLYNYDTSSMTKEVRSSFKRNIKANIQKLFGHQSDVVLSQSEKEIIKSSIEKYTVVSNVPGFAPNLITEEGQIVSEANRLNAYLDQNPTLNATMEMKLFPFSKTAQIEHFLSEQFKEIYNKEVKCYTDWEIWNGIKSKVQFVYNSTQQDWLKNAAYQALAILTSRISDSSDCTNSITPSGAEYGDILSHYKQEELNREIQLALTPVYHYDSNHRNLFLNSPDLNLSNEWTYKGTPFEWFNYQFSGTVPLYKFRNYGGSDKDIYYSQNPDRPANGLDGDYNSEGVVGYVFPNQVPGSVPLVRYQFKDGQHSHTAVPSIVAQRDASNEFTNKGILGYVFL